MSRNRLGGAAMPYTCSSSDRDDEQEGAVASRPHRPAVHPGVGSVEAPARLGHQGSAEVVLGDHRPAHRRVDAVGAYHEVVGLRRPPLQVDPNAVIHELGGGDGGIPAPGHPLRCWREGRRAGRHGVDTPTAPLPSRMPPRPPRTAAARPGSGTPFAGCACRGPRPGPPDPGQPALARRLPAG